MPIISLSQSNFAFLFIVWVYCCAFFSSNAHAYSKSNDNHAYPFYVGVTGGYGTTTWEGLVPPKDRKNLAIGISTPTYVSEGGTLWGLFAGYEFSRYFALETSYMRYPNAKISFAKSSLFTFLHNGQRSFTTKTESISLMGKIMLLIPHSPIRAYSSFGVAEVHRCDELNDHWIVSPTFGVGLNYNITNHVMSELGGNYIAGNGKSELNPTEDYFPFLFSIFLRLAYLF